MKGGIWASGKLVCSNFSVFSLSYWGNYICLGFGAPESKMVANLPQYLKKKWRMYNFIRQRVCQGVQVPGAGLQVAFQFISHSFSSSAPASPPKPPFFWKSGQCLGHLCAALVTPAVSPFLELPMHHLHVPHVHLFSWKFSVGFVCNSTRNSHNRALFIAWIFWIYKKTIFHLPCGCFVRI